MREDKGRSCRDMNITAARAVADAVRTSLGPRGMDKMIQSGKGDVVITNDGATILKKMKLQHPCAKMVADLSAAQDVEAGDGTTSVVVITGALLGAAQRLLNKGLHPQRVTEAFLKAASMSDAVLKEMSVPVDLTQRGEILKAAKTSLSSKVVSQNSDILGPIAVDAVLKAVGDLNESVTNVDLNDIRVSKKLGGTIEDCELVDGLVLTQNASRNAGGPTRVSNAKVGLIQFCLSPPKTDMESNVVIKDYAAMDRLLREERLHLAKMVKQIAKTGCNVLLIQKSILRDATTDLSLDFCAKAKIMVVRDIERDEVDFIARVLGLEPASTLDTFTEAKLGHCDLVHEENLGGDIGSVIRFNGLKAQAQNCVSVLVRATNLLTLDETERSLHDALCVVRSLVKTRALLPGGGAVEMELAVKLSQLARGLPGEEAHCVRAFAEALEIVPYTLAENAGLPPVEIVTALRAAHANGDCNAGINVRKGQVGNMLDENVLMPLLISQSYINMATETVRMILKIDDLVMVK